MYEDIYLQSMQVILNVRKALPFINMLSCISCTGLPNADTFDIGAVASSTATEVFTLMPEQECPEKLFGSNLERDEVVHPSARLCHYSS